MTVKLILYGSLSPEIEPFECRQRIYSIKGCAASITTKCYREPYYHDPRGVVKK